MLPGIALTFATLIASPIGVLLVRRWSEQRQLLAIPNERSSHKQPVPVGGGLPIAILTLLALIIWGLWPGGSLPSSVIAFIVGGAMIAAVSWLDDMRPLPATPRILVHGLGAVIAIGGAGYWNPAGMSLSYLESFQWIGLPFTFLWIVGMINAFNFLDGLDGLAGSAAVVGGLAWALLGMMTHQPFVAMLGLLLAISTFGFLTQNWPPAKIFMGDVGATFLGYAFAVLPLFASDSDSRLFLSGPLLVWPCLFDSIFTVLARLRRGENVFAAHRSFLFQRLNKLGYSHLSVTLLYTSLSLVGAALGVAWANGAALAPALIVVLLPVLGASLYAFVVYKEARVTLFQDVPGSVAEEHAS